MNGSIGLCDACLMKLYGTIHLPAAEELCISSIRCGGCKRVASGPNGGFRTFRAQAITFDDGQCSTSAKP